MANLITGSCNCNRHTYTIPKPTEMNLCRISPPLPPISFHTTPHHTTPLQLLCLSKLTLPSTRLHRLPQMGWRNVSHRRPAVNLSKRNTQALSTPLRQNSRHKQPQQSPTAHAHHESRFRHRHGTRMVRQLRLRDMDSQTGGCGTHISQSRYVCLSLLRVSVEASILDWPRCLCLCVCVWVWSIYVLNTILFGEYRAFQTW